MKLTRKQLRTLMMWQMMPHMLLGHPIAALLSRAGHLFWRKQLWAVCEWWHYDTLPARARTKIKQEHIDYDHHPSVFWIDFFFAPATHLLGALGLHYWGFRLYMLGPLEAALEHSTHFNFLLWSVYSTDPKEREEAAKLLAKGRNRRAQLAMVGRPRWPQLAPLPKRAERVLA